MPALTIRVVGGASIAACMQACAALPCCVLGGQLCEPACCTATQLSALCAYPRGVTPSDSQPIRLAGCGRLTYGDLFRRMQFCPGYDACCRCGVRCVLQAAVLAEIYLCNVCSCQELLRRNGRG
jgi:hypothetical protein